VNRHKPSVDVLFDSAAANAGKNAIGVILTGMGKDGAAGMARMREAGSFNYAQNEESCVVYGMPREAVAHGGVDEVAHLTELPKLVMTYLMENSTRSLRV
jgi:two-component system, chemotaxis family, protein-glutamate methylesterase/glutaminase